jgi:hypothetical protein
VPACVGKLSCMQKPMFVCLPALGTSLLQVQMQLAGNQ